MEEIFAKRAVWAVFGGGAVGVGGRITLSPSVHFGLGLPRHELRLLRTLS